ncbi:MAG: LysE family translocator [Granulosicoccaceae bacterium]
MQEFLHYLPGIALSLSAFCLALLSPGPNVLAVIGTSMGVGRRQGIALAVGVASGTFCWVLLTVLGFVSVITRYAELMLVLKVLGGCYLFWLGYKSLRSAASAKASDTTELHLCGGVLAYFRRGFVVQMSNPKAAFANLAIVSLAMQSQAPWWVGAVIVFGASSLSLIGHCLYALAFSTQTMVRAYTRCRRSIEALLGAFFVAMGFRLLSDRS